MNRRFFTPVNKRRIPGSFNRAGALLVLGLVAFATLVGVFGAIRPESTSAAASTTLTFQARLLNTSGSLVADGTYNVEFKIYDTVGSGASAQGVCSLDSSTDDCWWLETRTGANKVTVKNGYVYANLGSVTAFSSTIPWDQELWITMNIGGTGAPSWDGEMSPRFKVAAVPYAFAAAKLQVTDTAITNKLVFATPSASNKTITLPNETGTVCTTGSICSGYVASTAGFIQNGNSFGTTATLGTNDAQSLVLETNNTARLTVTSAGDATFSGALTTTGQILANGGRPVTINPTGGDVRIKGSSGGWAMGYFFNGNAGTDRGGFGALGSADALTYYYIGPSYTAPYMTLSSGNIGIGLTNPGANLDILGTNTAINSKGNIFVASSDSIAIDKGGQLTLGGVWTGTTTTRFGAIAGRKENATDGNAAGYLQLSTSDSSGGALTEKLRITSTGNVGIGTTTPGQKLEVNGNILLGSGNNIYGTGNGLTFTRTGTTTMGFAQDFAGSAFEQAFWGAGVRVSSSSSNPTAENNIPAGTLIVDGNVGIGTTAPSGILSVTPTQYSTGTASQSLTTVTGVGTTFTAAMVGSQLVYANGVSAGTITAFNSITSLTVSTSQTVTAQAYNIAYTGLQVGSTGNVGIGTTAPGGQLEIKNGTNSLIFNQAGYSNPSINANNNLYINPGGIRVLVGGNGFGGVVATQFGVVQSGAQDIFSVSDSTQNNAYLYVKNGGNVGIGTAAPSGKLHVVQTADTIANQIERTTVDTQGASLLNIITRSPQTGVFTREPEIRLNNTNSTANNFTTIENYGSNGAVTSGIDFINVDQAYNGAIRFNTRSLVGSYGERMRIDGSGNVGIGDTTPASLLTVGSGDLFQVNSSGAIVASTGIANSGGYVQSGVTANTFTGASTFSAAGTGLAVTNNATVGGTLVVTSNATVTGGTLSLNNATSNFVQYGTTGVGAPTFTTRSAGTKEVYYNQVGAASVDYAVGIESGTLWNSVPTTAQQFKWYGGTTQAALLSGTGNLTLGTGAGTLTSGLINGQTISSSANFTGTLTAAGNITLTNGADRRLRLGSSTNYFYDVQATGDDFQIIEAGDPAKVRLHIDYPTGNVGIGDTTPASLLTVGSGDLFQVNSSGAIVASTGIATSGGYTQSGSTANTFTGASTFSAAGTGLAVTNNATIGGTLGVTGLSTLGKVNQGSSATERYYPNVISDTTAGTALGAWVIHTPIPRSSNNMSRIHISGYAYGTSSNIDFYVVVYPYSGCVGNVDAAGGCTTSYRLEDNGDDGLNKYVGIDAAGKLAIAFGDTSLSAYFYRISVDGWITSTTTDYSTGWSIDRSVTAGFGWLDKNGPLVSSRVGQIFIDTNTGAIGIGAAGNASYKLQVTGALNVTTNLFTGGTQRISSTGVLSNVTNADASTFFTGGALTVARGGTGAGTFTTNGVLYGNTTGALQVTAASTAANQCLITSGIGTVPIWGSCTAGGGVTTMAAIGATPNANGATISTNTLTLQPADASFGGVVTTGTQTFAGAKTFTSNLEVRNAAPSITVGTATNTDGALYFGNSGHGVKRNYSGANDVGLYTTAADLYLAANGAVTNQFVLKNSGNVGIGTNAPISLLEAKAGNGVVGNITITGGNTTVIAVGEINSRLDFRQNDASMSSTNQIAGSIASVTEFNNGAYAGLAFYTGKQGRATVLQEAVRINNDGYVGIGTTAPSGILSVTPTQYSTGTASQSLTTVTGVGTTFTAAMIGSQLVYANGVSAGTITAFGSITSLTVSTSQTVTAQAYNIAYTGLQVGSTGNVGIGTTSPAYKFDVTGTLRASGAVGFNGSAPGDAAGGQATGLAVTGYSGLGGLRVNGADTANTIYQAGLSMGITAGGNLTLTPSLGGTSMFLHSGGGVAINYAGVTPVAQLDVNISSAAKIGQIVKGAAAQTADLQQWQDSAGTVLTKVNSAGDVVLGSTSLVQSQYLAAIGNTGAFFQLTTGGGVSLVNRTATSNVALKIRGMAAQSGDLLQLQDSASTILTAFDSAGKLVFGPSGAQDTNLYRSAADNLKTDDSLSVAGTLYAAQGTANQVLLGSAGPSGQAGALFGSALDTNLYRSAADTLATDDSLAVSRFLRVGGTTVDTTRQLQVGGTHPGTGATLIGLEYAGTFPSTTITRADGLRVQPNTAVAAFTLARMNVVTIEDAVKGAGSTITDQYGLNLQPQTQGTNNYSAAIGASSTQTLWLSNNANNTTAAAGIAFGSSRDTNLYRSAADTLKTDDTFIAATALQSPSLDVASAGTLSLGTSTATAVTLGKAGITTTNSGALTVNQLFTGVLGATISGATTSINASSNFATNINTGTSNGAISLGNSVAGVITLQSASTIGLTGTSTHTGLSAGAGTALTVTNSTSTGSIFVAQDNSTAVLTVADGGSATFRNSTNSTTAFQIQDSAGTSNLVVADTTNSKVGIATTPTSTGATVQVNGNVSATTGVVLNATGNSNSTITKSMVVSSTVNANDVVIIDTGSAGKVTTTNLSGSDKVFGIATSTQGSINQTQNIVIAGIYQVTADTGAIAIGDSLLTSATTGQVTASNAGVAGSVIGRALSSKTAGSSGLVWAQVTPGQGGNGVGNSNAIGTISSYGGSTAPANWLIADGTAVSRTTYADLFAVIGTTYGVGDGSTTFNLPDLRGRQLTGLDNMGGSDAGRQGAANTLGGSGGEYIHDLTTAELPSHTHSITDMQHDHTAGTAGDGTGIPHRTTNPDGAGTSGWGFALDSGATMYWTNNFPVQSAYSGIITTAGCGSCSGTDFNVLDPYLFTNYIIRATNNGSGNVASLQGAYDGGNTLTVTNARDITITLADTATDSNFILNVASGSTSKFAVQYNGADTFSISNAASAQGSALFKNATNNTTAFQIQNSTAVPLVTVDSTNKKLTVATDIVATGAATATTGTTEATARTNVTTVTLTVAGSFANNDVIFLDNAGQDYYTRIVSGGGTTALTVSPAVSYDVSTAVTKYTAQSIGVTSSDYATLNNRFFQGYFLGGVVTGAGSTTLSDGNLSSSGNLVLQSTSGNVGIGTGTTTPASLLSVGSTSQFQVNSSGAIVASTGIANSGAYTQSGSTANTFTGASTFSASGTALSVTNNATIGGTLIVQGSSMTFGTTTQAGSLVVSDGSSSTVTFKSATQVAATNYDLTVPAITVSDTFCLLTLANCGSAGVTLQAAYGNDGDGSDSIIALTTADDSIIFRNPSSSGTDSGFVLTVDQLNTGAVGGLFVSSVGTGALLKVTDATATARDVLTVADGGAATFRNQTDSTTAFQIQDSAGTSNLVVADTTNSKVGIATAPTSTGATVQVVGNVSATTGVVLNATGNSNSTITKSTVVTAAVSANDVVVINTASAGQVTTTSTGGSTGVFGIATQTLGAGQTQNIVIAGIYQVTADTTAVAIGDQLITSATTGQVTPASNPASGQSIGRALSSKSAGSSGLVWVQVTPGSGGNNVNDSNAVGTITAYSGSTAPNGWLMAYGQAISRTTYADLFAAIGTTYGTGDGSTTFNLPDLRGRNLVAVDNMGGSDAGRLNTANTLGGTGGEQLHDLTVAELPAHDHTINHDHSSSEVIQPGTQGGTQQRIYGDYVGGGGQSSATPNLTSGVSAWGSAAYVDLPNFTGTSGTCASCTGTDFNVLDPYLLTNYIIRATTGVVNTANGNGPQSAKMRRAAAQSINDQTWTKIAFDTEDFDVGDIADYTTNDRFNIKKAGKYLINANFPLPNLTVDEQIFINIYVNGVAMRGTTATYGNTGDPGVSASDIFSLNVNDYIEMYVYQNNTANAAKNTNTVAEANPVMSVVQLDTSGNATTLQGAYDMGRLIATTDARDITITLSDTTTDSNLLVNVASGSTSRFGVQYNGVDTFSISNAASAQGSALFKNATNNTTAFQIQNASGTQLFVADATNNRIYVGNVTGDTTGTLLVLDTKTDSGDPTGVNGGMYYNSNSGKFRCYENSAWHDCAGGTLASGFVSVASDQTGITTEVDITSATVTVTTPANRRIRISYQLAFYSTTAANSIGIKILRDGSTIWTDQGPGLGTAGTSAYSTVGGAWHIDTPSGGSHTYKLRAYRIGTGEANIQGSASPTQLLIEDIGQ